MLLLVDTWYLDAPNEKYRNQLTSLYQQYMCQSQTCWVQASSNQDHERLACKHWLALWLHWHIYLILAVRYWFLLWCCFNLYAKLVIRWDVVGILALACAHCILTWKQKDSLLELNSSDWPHMESSCTYTSSACSWWALGALGLKDTCFLKHKLVKCLYLWQDLYWYFLAGYLKPSTCLESPHLEHLSLLVWACLGSNCFLLWWQLLLLTCIPLLTGWSWVERLLLLMLACWEVCVLMSH